MNNRLAALASAIATIAVACQQFASNYDVEVHIVPVWGVDEDLPERLTR